MFLTIHDNHWKKNIVYKYLLEIVKNTTIIWMLNLCDLATVPHTGTEIIQVNSF